MNKRALCALIAVVLTISALLSGCAREYGDTDEFRTFLKEKSLYESVNRAETSQGYTYVLEDGILTFLDDEGNTIWSSNQYWYVDDFRLFDIDGDGNTDCLFSLWKSYSFYEGYDENDDPSVKNHLFLYTIRAGYAKSLWGSSNLPRPIYSFELSEGTPTPVSTGAVLRTVEGKYTDNFSKDEQTEFRYTWQGWGFVPEDDLSEDALQLDSSEVKLSFVGDLMVHSRQLYMAYQADEDTYNFEHSFEYICKYIASADYTIGNLETVFGGNNTGYTDFPFFNTPDEFAFALREAGFDMLTTANNHCNDRGESGIIRTIDVLESLGLDHIGTYKSDEERNKVFFRELNGIKFAFLSYTYGTNGNPITTDKPYLVNVLNEALIREDIQRAKLENPDIIIVLPHMGDEYENQPSDEWRDWAKFMLECGADIVVASHPHVLQPVEFVHIEDGDEARTGFIAYSTGNFLSSQREPPTDAGMILSLYFKRDETGEVYLSKVSYIPTWVKFTDDSGHLDITVLPILDTLNVVENGINMSLRDNDILRLKNILTEQSRLFLGQEPTKIEQGEYIIKLT